jgi:hypothetical protein
MGWTTCVKEWINKEDEYHPGGDIYYKNINDSNLVSDNIKQLKIKHGITKIKDIIGKDLFVPNEFTQNDFENSIFMLSDVKIDQLTDKNGIFNHSCIKQGNIPYHYVARHRTRVDCDMDDSQRYPYPSTKCNSDDKGQLWYLYKGKLCSMKDDTCLQIVPRNTIMIPKLEYIDRYARHNLISTNDKNYIQNTNDKTQQWKLEKVLGGFNITTKQKLNPIYISGYGGGIHNIPEISKFNFAYPSTLTYMMIAQKRDIGVTTRSYTTYNMIEPSYWTTGMIIPIYQLKKKENNEFKSMPDPPIGGYWRMQDFCKNDEYTNKFNTNIKNEFKPIFNQFGFKESDIFTMSKLNNIKYFPDWATTKFPSEDIENCNWKEKWEKIKELSKGYIYMNNWCPYLYLRDKENINQCNYPQIVEAMFKCRAYDLNDLSCFPKRIEIHEKLCEKYGFTKNDSDVYEGCTLNTIMIKEQENLTKEIKKLNEELSVSIDEFRRQNLENQKRQLEHQLELFEQQQKSADRLADKTIKNIDDIVSFFDKEKESQEMKEKRIKNTAILLGILLFIFILFM